MPDFQKGTTFSDTGAGADVNAATLNNLVDGATALPGLIVDKAANTAPADADSLLTVQNTSGQLRKVLLSVLQTYILGPLRSAPIVQVFGLAASPTDASLAPYQTARFMWVRTTAGNAGRTISFWDSTVTVAGASSAGAWRPISCVPLGTIVQYAGNAANFDGSGAGYVSSMADGWHYCDATGALTATASGAPALIRYVGP